VSASIFSVLPTAFDPLRSVALIAACAQPDYRHDYRRHHPHHKWPVHDSQGADPGKGTCWGFCMMVPYWLIVDCDSMSRPIVGSDGSCDLVNWLFS